MGSVGSVSKPTEGLLVGLVQYPVPVVNSRADIDKQVEQIVKAVHTH